MLRFVLRSNFAVQSIRSRLAWLQTALPELRVISVNIQPVHMAVLEGEEEHILTQQQSLYEQWNGVPLFIRPGSFFQTNAVVAAQLYSCARDWTQALPRKLIWDLFCGVGGFGLHCADEDSELIGIEVSTEAIKSAEMSAQQLGLRKVSFQALPALDFALQQMPVPDLVIVNPPRRGIGQEMCRYLSGLAPTHLLYSSCNAQTLALDLANLPCYELVRVQLFDMFPHTAHFETLVLLRRRVS